MFDTFAPYHLLVYLHIFFRVRDQTAFVYLILTLTSKKMDEFTVPTSYLDSSRDTTLLSATPRARTWESSYTTPPAGTDTAVIATHGNTKMLNVRTDQLQ
jgi:hypothetical protein